MANQMVGKVATKYIYLVTDSIKVARQVFDYRIMGEFEVFQGQKQPAIGPIGFDECWNFSGPTNTSGSPVIYSEEIGKPISAKVAMVRDHLWTYFNDGLFGLEIHGWFERESETSRHVHLTCGNRCCTNPTHIGLFDTPQPQSQLSGIVQLHDRHRSVIKFLYHNAQFATAERLAHYYGISLSEVRRIANDRSVNSLKFVPRFFDWDLWRYYFPNTVSKIQIKRLTPSYTQQAKDDAAVRSSLRKANKHE